VSHALTPTPTAPDATSVVVPDAGDARTAASVATPMQSLTNMVHWLFGVLTGSISRAVTLLGGLTTRGLTVPAGFDADFGRNAIVRNNLTVLGATSVGSNLVVSGDHDVAGDLTAATETVGYLSVSNALVASGTISYSGTGRQVIRVNSAPGAVGRTASPKVASLYYIQSGSAVGSTFTIDDTGAVDGDQIRFYSADAVRTITIKDPTGVDISALTYASGLYISLDVTRIGGVWKATGGEKV
jgi:hypothetical protein